MNAAEIHSAIVSHLRVADSAVIGRQEEDERPDEIVEEIRAYDADRVGKSLAPNL